MMLKLQVVTLTIVSFFFTLVMPFESLVLAMSKPAPEPTPKKTEGWLVPRELVESTDLKIVWQFDLPLSEQESLDKLFIFGSRLCALSSRNFLSCLNRADSNVIFSGNIAPPGLPLAGIECFKDELITIVGSSLNEISIESGAQKASMPIATGAVCPVVRNDDFFYIAGFDKRLHALKASNKILAFEAAAEKIRV